MIFRHEHHRGIWVDLEQPTENEIRDIAREFSVSERLETELLSPTPFPLVAHDDGVSLLVLHFPTRGSGDGDTRNQEIDFIVGSHFIITVRYEVVAPLDHLRKLFDTEQLIDGELAVTADVLLEILFAHLYASVRNHVNLVADHLTRAEREMFSGAERLTVRSISSISREFLHLEAALANQEEPLTRFLQTLARRGFFGQSFTERVERILAERSQVLQLARTFRAVATELRETNAALFELRQNEVMKTLTAITFIVMPLELVSFIFGMHAIGTPLEKNPNAFWIIVGVMAAIGFLTALFAAHKRWL